MYNSFDNGECTVAVFLDFAKAFDSLDRNVLFAKLEYYVIKEVTLNWFKSYLSDRKQFVKYRGVEFELLTTRYGTAQGSVLGPLLYLIFVNDIVHSSSILKFTIYADDTCVYFSDRNAINGVEIINRELVFVTKWIRANRLTLNMNECHYICQRSLPNLLPEVLNWKFWNWEMFFNNISWSSSGWDFKMARSY